jgi:D-serine deaminase-like pyridoxal phosphate-dependent protein
MKWFTIQNVDTIDSPALVVYKERVHKNIQLLKEMVHGNVGRLRPHVKTNKITEVCLMMMEAGITKFKCATIAEAEMLALIEAPDVLLSYQPVGPKAHRLAALIEKYPATKFATVVDNMQVAEKLSQLFAERKLTLDVYIDLNTGMNRTGIPAEHATQLFEAMHSLPALKVVGLHGYDGHIRDTNVDQRKQHVEKGFSKVLILAAAIEAVSNQYC